MLLLVLFFFTRCRDSDIQIGGWVRLVGGGRERVLQAEGSIDGTASGGGRLAAGAGQRAESTWGTQAWIWGRCASAEQWPDRGLLPIRARGSGLRGRDRDKGAGQHSRWRPEAGDRWPAGSGRGQWAEQDTAGAASGGSSGERRGQRRRCCFSVFVCARSRLE